MWSPKVSLSLLKISLIFLARWLVIVAAVVGWSIGIIGTEGELGIEAEFLLAFNGHAVINWSWVVVACQGGFRGRHMARGVFGAGCHGRIERYTLERKRLYCDLFGFPNYSSRELFWII
jgi:hypothetical protein